MLRNKCCFYSVSASWSWPSRRSSRSRSSNWSSRNSCYALSDYRTPMVGLIVQWLVLAGLGAVLVPLVGVQGLAIAIVAGEVVTSVTMGSRLAMKTEICMRLQQEEGFDEAAPPRSRVGLVLGLWLSGVFAASLGGWLEAGHERTTSLVLLGVAVVWPLLYFVMGRCRFFPRLMPLAATGGLMPSEWHRPYPAS